jgi:phage tail-like protein
MSDTSTDLKGELPTAASFLFEVDGVEIGVFSQVSGLEVRVEVATYQEGGENGYLHNLPGRMTWPNIVLRRGVTDSDALFSWVNKAAGDGFSANNNSLTRSTGAITVIGTDGQRLRAWQLQGVFAVHWRGPNFDAGSTDPLSEELELAHHGFTCKTY